MMHGVMLPEQQSPVHCIRERIIVQYNTAVFWCLLWKLVTVVGLLRRIMHPHTSTELLQSLSGLVAATRKVYRYSEESFQRCCVLLHTALVCCELSSFAKHPNGAVSPFPFHVHKLGSRWTEPNALQQSYLNSL